MLHGQQIVAGGHARAAVSTIVLSGSTPSEQTLESGRAVPPAGRNRPSIVDVPLEEVVARARNVAGDPSIGSTIAIEPLGRPCVEETAITAFDRTGDLVDVDGEIRPRRSEELTRVDCRRR